jgi:hypothetical protein
MKRRNCFDVVHSLLSLQGADDRENSPLEFLLVSSSYTIGEYNMRRLLRKRVKCFVDTAGSFAGTPGTFADTSGTFADMSGTIARGRERADCCGKGASDAPYSFAYTAIVGRIYRRYAKCLALAFFSNK